MRSPDVSTASGQTRELAVTDSFDADGVQNSNTGLFDTLSIPLRCLGASGCSDHSHSLFSSSSATSTATATIWLCKAMLQSCLRPSSSVPDSELCIVNGHLGCVLNEATNLAIFLSRHTSTVQSTSTSLLELVVASEVRRSPPSTAMVK